MKGTFNGKRMSYLASHYETILYEKNNYNKPMASIFVTEYRSLFLMVAQAQLHYGYI